MKKFGNSRRDPSDIPPLPVPGKVKLTRLERKMLRPWWRPALEFLIYVVICLLLAVAFKTWLFRVFYVPSESMNPALVTDDKIVVDVLTPNFKPYTRGDVVVFADAGDWLGDGIPTESGAAFTAENLLVLAGIVPDQDGYLVKRVVGLPGEVIQGKKDGTILVDGDPLIEPWAQKGPQKPFKVELDDGEYWMLGDNREHSADSRMHGAVERETFIGRVVGVFFPFDRMHLVDWLPWLELMGKK